MKKYLIVLLSYGVLTGYSQEIDSLRAKLSSSINQQEKLQTALILSKAFMKSNADSMHHYASLSLGCITDQTDPVVRSEVYANYISSLVESGDYEHLKSRIEKYLPFIESTNNLKALSSVYTSFGTYYLQKNQPERAIDWYYKSFEMDEKIGDEQGMAGSLGNIALLQKRTGEYERAMDNFMQSLRIYQRLGEEETALRILVNICGFYSDQNATIYQLDSAIAYGRASLKLAKKLNFPFGIAMAGSNLSAATCNKNLDKLINKEEVLEGLEAVTYARQFFSTTNFVSHYHNAMINEALSYEILGEDDRAVELAKSLVSSPNTAALANRILYKVNQKSGNFQQALIHHERYKAIEDSLNEASKRSQLAELQTKYETVRKDAEIEALSQEKAISQLEVRQKNTQMWIIGVSSTFSLILIYLFYQQKTIKARHQHAELEHRFLRFQLNPHFIFNALASIQHFMLKNSAEEAGIYLAKFSKLMRQILENSRQEFIPVHEEVKMLTNYLDVHQLDKSRPFTYEIEVDDQIDQESELIPPMFVQPFVENAIEHGISSAKGEGRISLRFKKELKFIRIEIADNGGGFSTVVPQSDHKSLASKIIQERIDLFNQNLKEKISFAIGEMRGDHDKIIGTKVELTVPFSYL